MPPADGTASWAADLVGESLQVLRDQRCWLGGPRAPRPSPGDRIIIRNPSPRLTVVLAGRCRHVIARQGQRTAFPGMPGDALFYAADAWSLRLAQEPTRFVGIVVARGYLRVLEGVHRGGRVPTPARASCHAPALLGSGLHLVQALQQRAAAGRADARIEGQLVRTLLLTIHEHLLALPADGPIPASRWHAVHEYLLEQACDPLLGRDAVARRLAMHPSHLSLLCTRHAGQGFHGVLETIRLERIRQRLEATDDAVGAIMRACGYTDAGTGIRAFRRRVGVTPTVFRRRAHRVAPPR